jgi:hypothetical protein
MRLTKAVVRRFEDEQKENGTETALRNLLWENATEQLRDIGVKRVHTSDKPATVRRRHRRVPLRVMSR